MPDDNSDKIWDEYDWERFLQQQEQRTERYMELLEKYIDHPQRDEIIAREMGWDHLLGNEEDDEWEEEVDAAFEREMDEDDESDDEFSEEEEQAILSCERNPLYRQAVAFASELDESLESLPSKVLEHPAAISLSSQTTLATAKLAAALCDDEIDELGMSIAYLKRALHAITGSLNSAKQLADAGIIPAQLGEKIFRRLFSLREGIVDKMGAYRTEFRRRFGQ